MIIKPHTFSSRSTLTEADVTPESIYHQQRRKFMQKGLYGLAGAAFASMSPSLLAKALEFKTTAYGKKETLTPEEAVTSYNNFYELGTGKEDPAKNASQLKTQDWSIENRRARGNHGQVLPRRHY
jgi:sulfoxide reductase catalytic subunit YedY